MRERFGSKRRAKEEILARYASFIHIGNSQYGFAPAAQYYFDRPLATFTEYDAEKAALLAGIAKSPRHYAPSAKETGRVLRRRDQTLGLMEKNGYFSRDKLREAAQRPTPMVARQRDKVVRAAGSLKMSCRNWGGAAPASALNPEDLLQGRIQGYATVDARVQQIVNEALEPSPPAGGYPATEPARALRESGTWRKNILP